MNENLLERLDDRHRDILALCGRAAAARNEKAYLVGGSVRDLILERPHDDLDIVVEGDGLAVAQAVSRALQGELTRHHAFQTATVATPGGTRVDVATARSEEYPRRGQLPRVAPGTLAEDLERRDFTFNAMAVALTEDEWGAFIDPLGGHADLAAGRIRVMHRRSFADDPTRVLRALRFALRFGYQIDDETGGWLRDAAAGGYLDDVSGARVRKEISLMFTEEPVRGPARLQREGVLAGLQEGLAADEALLQGIVAAQRWFVDEVAARHDGEPVPPLWTLVLAGCAASVPQQGRWELVRRLRLSRRERAPLLESGTQWQRARETLQAAGDAPAPSAVAEACSGMSSGALLVVIGGAADGATERALRSYLQTLRWIEPDLAGDDLEALGVPHGPMVGDFLRRLRAARQDGKVSDAAGERALVTGWLAAERR